MEVQEAGASGSVVSERVGEVRRGGDEGAGRQPDRLVLGAELEVERTLEHVKGVGVAAVDVRVGTTLARLVPSLVTAIASKPALIRTVRSGRSEMTSPPSGRSTTEWATSSSIVTHRTVPLGEVALRTDL